MPLRDESGASRHPFLVYLIGGIGAGKSEVINILQSWGVATFDLDEAGQRALCTQAVKTALKDAFGPEIFDEQGRVVRARLAQRVFSNSADLQRLNDITTPAIVQALEQWHASLPKETQLCVVEVSAYDGSSPRFPEPDEILAVVADEALRVQRACLRGMSEEDVRARIGAQPSDDERRMWADVVIENNAGRRELVAALFQWCVAHKMSLSDISRPS